MKKSILLMLLLMIPLLTVAQKRNKKSKKSERENVEIEKIKSSFMVLKGVEVSNDQLDHQETYSDASDVDIGRKIKDHTHPTSHFYFSFDYGDPNNVEVNELMNSSVGFSSMAEAVNLAAKYGWEFINSTIVVDGVIIIHYYYMKR